MYGLGLSTGSLTVFGSFNDPANDVVRDALLLPSVNALTNVLGATVVFSVAGFVATSLGKDDLDDLNLSGGALAFQTYSTVSLALSFCSFCTCISLSSRPDQTYCSYGTSHIHHRAQ